MLSVNHKSRFLWMIAGCFCVLLLSVSQRASADEVTAAADLYVEELSFDPAFPQPDEPFNISVIVGNQGDEVSAVGDVILFIDPETEPPTATTTPQFRLGSLGLPFPLDSTVPFNRNGQTLAAGVYKVYVLIDADGEVAESDETNNLYGPIDLSVGGDEDGDGISDLHELNGYDSNEDGIIDIDFAALGATPGRKDIFVEIDYMVDTFNTYQPDPDAIAKIVEVFANAPVSNPDGSTGIRLHVDYGADAPLTWGAAATWGALSHADEIPYSEYLSSCAEVIEMSWDQFDQTKQLLLTNARRPFFHYNVWGDKLCPERPGTIVASRNDTTSGTVSAFKQGASDFILTAGPWLEDDYDSTPTSNQLAGAFMHGLGLNLGLTRGSTDFESYKPNHFSVMNPLFATNGLRRNGSWFHFDYSRSADLIVDENSLDEGAGMGVVTADSKGTDGTIIICDDASTAVQSLDRIDWDCDGEINSSTTISLDINLSGVIGPLETVNEWDQLVYAGGDIGEFDDNGEFNPFNLPRFNLPNLLDVAIVDNVPAFFEETQFGEAAFAFGNRESTQTVYLPMITNWDQENIKVVEGANGISIVVIERPTNDGGTRFSVGGAEGTYGSANAHPPLAELFEDKEITMDSYVWNSHRDDLPIRVMRSCLFYREDKNGGAGVGEHYIHKSYWRDHICWDYQTGKLAILMKADECATGKPCIGKTNEAEQKFREMLQKHRHRVWLIGNEPDFRWEDALVDTLVLKKDDGGEQTLQVGGAETYAEFYAYMYRLGQDELGDAPKYGFCQAAFAGTSPDHADSGLPYCKKAYNLLDEKLRAEGITLPKQDTIHVLAAHQYLFHSDRFDNQGKAKWLDSDQLNEKYLEHWENPILEFECWAGSSNACKALGMNPFAGEETLNDKPLWLTEFGALNAWCHEDQSDAEQFMQAGGEDCDETGRGRAYFGRNSEEGLWGLWTKQVDYLHNKSERWEAAWVFVSHSGEVTANTQECTRAGTIWVFQFKNDRNARRCRDADLWKAPNEWMPKLSQAGGIYKFVVLCATRGQCNSDGIDDFLLFQTELSYEALVRLYPIQTAPFDPYCKVTEFDDCSDE